MGTLPPDEPTMYCHIGHADPDDIIWIWNLTGHSGLTVRKSENETHELIWGKVSEKHWRGRFEKKTKRVSMLAPDIGQLWHRPAPQELLDTLEDFFGTKDMFQFNPRR